MNKPQTHAYASGEFDPAIAQQWKDWATHKCQAAGIWLPEGVNPILHAEACEVAEEALKNNIEILALRQFISTPSSGYWDGENVQVAGKTIQEIVEEIMNWRVPCTAIRRAQIQLNIPKSKYWV
jgi:hypothetical protein